MLSLRLQLSVSRQLSTLHQPTQKLVEPEKTTAVQQYRKSKQAITVQETLSLNRQLLCKSTLSLHRRLLCNSGFSLNRRLLCKSTSSPDSQTLSGSNRAANGEAEGAYIDNLDSLGVIWIQCAVFDDSFTEYRGLFGVGVAHFRNWHSNICCMTAHNITLGNLTVCTSETKTETRMARNVMLCQRNYVLDCSMVMHRLSTHSQTPPWTTRSGLLISAIERADALFVSAYVARVRAQVVTLFAQVATVLAPKL